MKSSSDHLVLCFKNLTIIAPFCCWLEVIKWVDRTSLLNMKAFYQMSEIKRRIQWNYRFIIICSGYCLIFAFWEYVQILNVFTRKLSIDLFSKLKLIWNISDNVNLETTREAFFINAKIIISYIEYHAQRSYYVLLHRFNSNLSMYLTDYCIWSTNTILLMPL